MADSTLASLTAATAGTGGLFYGTQSGADRKFTLTAVGATLAEAADAAAQRTALACAALAANTFSEAQTIASGTLTASAPALNITQTWNNGAVTFHADDYNITNTASQAASTLLRRQVGGVDFFSVRRDGKVQLRGSGGANDMLVSVLTGQGNGYPVFNFQDGSGGIGTGWICGHSNTTGAAMVVQRGLELGSNCPLLWGNSGPLQGALDTALTRIEAGVLALTNASTGGGSFEFTEISDPSAPASNKARLYVKDNGSGKTQIAVRFPTGAVQVIATEP